MPFSRFALFGDQGVETTGGAGVRPWELCVLGGMFLSQLPRWENAMSKFLFLLSRGPEDATRAVRCFQFAKIAAEKGHDVTVFLVDDAVYFTNLGLAERVKCPTGDELLPYLKAVQEKGRILVCKPCAATRMIGEDDLPANFEISTGVAMIDIAEEAKVFSF